MGHHRRDLQQPLNRTALPVNTSDGQFLAIYSEQGLAELHFPSPVPSPRASAPGRSPSRQVSQWHQLTISAVSAILNAGVPSAMPPFDLSPYSDFQRSVWAEMRKLSIGETISYGELAARLGMPGGARAVGNACGANPIPLLIPCHRILASGGRLGGFSGGLDWKRKLLQREDVRFREVSRNSAGSNELFLLEF